jgi:CRP/FNR family transcriptional regulator
LRYTKDHWCDEVTTKSSQKALSGLDSFHLMDGMIIFPGGIAAGIMETVRKDIHNSDMPVLCQACEARHRGVCGAMTPEQLTELSRYTARKVIRPGAELHGQGERILSYANILKGVVKLTKVMADGRQQIVGLQFAPDFIGRPFSPESSLTAEAATEAEICAVSKPALDRMVTNAPDLERRLHQQALAELDEARDWMLTLGRKNAREKVASFLYLIATHCDPHKDHVLTFELPLTRQDIGDFLGLTIETVSRQMTKLRQEKIIDIEHNRQVTVHGIERLAEVAGLDV